MKKILKCITILFILFVLMFIINIFRNYIILKNIYELGNNIEIGENYRIKKQSITAMGTSVINYYYRDNKYLYIEDLDNGYNSFIFHNLDTDEYNEFSANENGELIPVNNQQKNDKSNIIEDLIYYKSYDFLELLKKNIFKIIKEDNENYILNMSNQDEYISKSNGLLTKIKSEENNIDIEIIFEKNAVDEKTIDITQYTIKNK